MRLAPLATALFVLLTGCQDVTQPPARAAQAPNRHHISYTNPTVTISGPTTIGAFTTQPPPEFTLTATASGGEGPYTYRWGISFDGESWGETDPIPSSSTTNSKTFWAEPSNHTIYIYVIVTDKWGHTASDSHEVRVLAI